MSKIFKSVAWFKIYFNSVNSYLGIVNFLLLLLTFKSIYKINISGFILIPVIIVIGVIIGFIDYQYIQREQNIIGNVKNDLKVDLLIIKEDLKKLLGEEK